MFLLWTDRFDEFSKLQPVRGPNQISHWGAIVTVHLPRATPCAKPCFGVTLCTYMYMYMQTAIKQNTNSNTHQRQQYNTTKSLMIIKKILHVYHAYITHETVTRARFMYDGMVYT